MKKEMKIAGMKCEGCANTVSKKFEAVSGVERAVIDLENQQAVVESEKDIPTSTFKEALADTPYEVVG